MTVRLYSYVGPAENLGLMHQNERRLKVTSTNAIRHWILETDQRLDDDILTVTFIVDPEGQLWISDRQSEHISCAAGQAVRSAGELSFSVSVDSIALHGATNQSTGYCPEPSSWQAVEVELNRIGLSAPFTFTTSFTFRRCSACGATNIVKDDWFSCGQCDADLDREWNFQPVNSAL